MPSKTIQLFLALTLATTLGACNAGDQGGKVNENAPATQQDQEDEASKANQGGEGGEGEENTQENEDNEDDEGGEGGEG